MARALFGEYLPDLPAHLSPGLAIADGVIPTATGYGPVGQFVSAQNGTMAGACLGAGAYRYQGATYIFSADDADIYRYQAAGHTSLKAGLTTNSFMRFCPYGKFMLATNGTDPIQRFDPATPTAFNNLDASAPVANFLAVVRGFLVAGYADNLPLRVQWSDTGVPTSWTPGGSSQAGLYDMPSGGDITGVVGGEYGLIFQERRIVRMSYTADDAVWQWDEISANVGCIAPWSLATWGRLTFFLSDKGFMVCDGTTVTPIGDQKVDRTFLGRAEVTYYDRMSAAFDPIHSLYVVMMPSTAPTSQAYLCSYLQNMKWTTATFTAERLLSSYGINTTLEELDAIYASIDAMTISLDSPTFKGGRPVLAMYDGSHTLGTLGGANMAATIVDARREFVANRRSRLRSVRPLTNAGTASCLVYGRNSLSDTDTTTTYSSRTSGGVYRTRESWNFLQLGLMMPAGADWTFAQGFDADVVAGGRA